MSWKDCDCGFCKPERMKRKAALVLLAVAIGSTILATLAAVLLIPRCL